MVLILIVANAVSFFTGERISSIYISLMILVSVVLGFWNEWSAGKTVEDLLRKISRRSLVFRNGKHEEIDTKDIVVGDIIRVSSGDIIPADAEILVSENFELNESVLTGESQPVYKKEGIVLGGTIVLNGWAIGKISAVGDNTQFGKIARDVSFVKPSTDFEKGIAKFGSMLIWVTLILASVAFLFNFFFQHSFLSSLLFALAIAVGLTPELLPIIITISLSHGAGKLSKKHVIAKQLVAIENLGNMDILCTDKTGTLTEGNIRVVELIANADAPLLTYGLLCNTAEVGVRVKGNPIDVSIWEYAQERGVHLLSDYKKIQDIPFDYEKSASFVVAEKAGEMFVVAKGSPEEILSRCVGGNTNIHIKKFKELSENGLRVLAVAKKIISPKKKYTWEDACAMDFCGFICFMDVPKGSARMALKRLAEMNVTVKVLTGDNEIVTRRICEEVGLHGKDILKGPAIAQMTDEILSEKINTVDIFARVTPEQKLRIIRLLKQKGHTLGYLGDGVNDVPALHSADVGISVDTAVDVAKDSANIVLLEHGLDAIVDGVMEGRKTFNNTIKYILMGVSSNFGNMFSASVSSVFLPFLPMTPAQILLNNGLYDVSQMMIPTDNVDKESLLKPKHWDVKFIRSYMLFFGPISSIFDFAIFGIMYFYFHANESLFQTGWFVESLATQVLVIFVIRTMRVPFFKSRPSLFLTISSLSAVLIAILLPYSPLAKSLGFSPLPVNYFLILGALVVGYLLLVEGFKRIFLKRFYL